MKQKKNKNLRSNITNGLGLTLLISAILTGCDSGTTTPAVTPGSISFSATSYTATEGAATVTVTVNRTGGSDGAASVDYTTSDGTAISTSDYTATNGTLSWADGETASKTIDINITDDSILEVGSTSSENFNISLNNVTNASLGTNASATIDITDNDSSLSFSSPSYTATEGTATVTVSLSRSGIIISGEDATVDYSTSDGTATSTNDYTATSGTLTWTSSSSSTQTITIPITDDNDIDPSESFSITLSNPSANLAIPSTSAVINIVDVVETGSINLTATNFSATEGTDTTVTITAARSGGIDGTASVDYTATDGTATSGDYTLTSGTLSWAAGETGNKTFDLTVTDDSTVELDENLTIDLSNVSAATLGTSQATVTISDNDGVAVTGTVSAPSGSVAFNGPTFLDRMFAMVFGKSAHALIGDLVSAVTSGTTVSIYEVDETGATVGQAITTAATDSLGTYVLSTPAFDAKYIVRADGSGGSKLDSRVASGTVDVDPVTDAASELISTITTDAAKLAALKVEEILQINEEISDLVEEIETTGAETASNLVTALKSAAQNDEAVNNVITSKVEAGEICGTVTNDAAAGLENILVVARDFGNWVTRAKTKTATDGTYCMNVPAGDYILGAINRTGDGKDPKRSASEWFTTAGGEPLQIDAEKVTVATTTVTRDFQLDPGIRIFGTVLGADGTLQGQAIEGGRVIVRDSDSNFSVAAARVKDDGTFRVNVKAGKYRFAFRNTSKKPYASIYNTTTANAAFDHNLLYGDVVDLNSATTPGTHEVNFTPSVGNKLTGTITEGGNPIGGPRVFVRDAVNGGVNNVLRSRKDGTFRIWLKPSTYNVYSYGQRDEGIDLTAGNYNVSFTADVAEQPVLITDVAGTAIGQAKIDVSTSDGKFLGRYVSNSDGTTNLYSSVNDAAHRLAIRVDTPETYGSTIYNNQTVFANATAVAMDPAAATPASFTVVLPDGGALRTVVTTDGTTPATNIPVQVRDGGTSGANKFVTNRTRGDGVSFLSIPGNTGSSRTYSAVRVNGSSGANCTNIPIENGKTTTLTFRTDTNACSFTGPI